MRLSTLPPPSAPDGRTSLILLGLGVTLFATIWFARHAEPLLHRFFPLWRWERELGWLDLRSFRRAEKLWRSLQWAVHAALVFALAALVLTAPALPRMWLRRHDLGAVAEDVPAAIVFLGSFVFWLYFLVVDLWPRIVARDEEAALRRYRAENPLEEEEERPRARLKGWGQPRAPLTGTNGYPSRRGDTPPAWPKSSPRSGGSSER